MLCILDLMFNGFLKYFFLFLLFVNCSQFKLGNKKTVIYSENIYSSSQGFLKEKYIHILDGKIVKLTSNYKRSGNEDFYNFKDNYILPGYIDSHTHLFLVDHSYDKNFPNELIKMTQMNNEKRFNLGKKNANSYLRNGFTSIRDLGNSGYFLDYKLSKEFAKAKTPRIYYTGPGICIKKCQFDDSAHHDQVSKEYTVIDENTDLDKIIEVYLDKEVKFLKIYLDNIPGLGQISEELFRKIVEKARNYGLKIVGHAISNESINLAIKYNIHSIEHGYDLKEITVKNKVDTIFIPTDLGIRDQAKIFFKGGVKKENLEYKLRSHYKQRYNRIDKLQKHGLIMAFGSDYYFPVNEKNQNYIDGIWEAIFLLKRYNISNIEIIRSLTLYGARALNDPLVGDIKENNFADFVILSKNPIENIKNINTVQTIFLNGRKISK